MTLDEYQREAERTAPRPTDAFPEALRKVLSLLNEPTCAEIMRGHNVLIWGLGLAGEAGEVCDLLKKVHGHGKPYDADKMRDELGDVLWYLAVLAHAHEFSLSEVAKRNVEKLKARHPKGFTVATANGAKSDECSAERPGYVCSNAYPCKAHGCLGNGKSSGCFCNGPHAPL